MYINFYNFIEYLERNCSSLVSFSMDEGLLVACDKWRTSDD